MASLFDTPQPTPSRAFPPHLRHLIVQLKAEYAGLRPNEIATMCYARTGRRPSPHTVKRVLSIVKAHLGCHRQPADWWSYVWTADQQPASITGTDSVQETYVYDADGARLKLTRTSKTAVYIGTLYVEEQATGDSHAFYTLNGTIIAKRGRASGVTNVNYLVSSQKVGVALS